MIFINKIENRTTFKIKTEYYLELLTLETKRLIGSTKSEITTDKNGKNVAHLGITEVILVHCNIVNNNYQQDSRVSYTFFPKELFGQLLDISPKNFIFLKSFNSQFSCIEVWFADQTYKLWDIEDKCAIQLNLEIEYL